MNKGWIVWIALVAIVAIVAYAYTGFNFHVGPAKTSSTTSTSSSILGGSTAPTTTMTFLVNCSNLYISGVAPYSSSNSTCQWGGGMLGVWVMAGSAYGAAIRVMGADGITYLQGGFNYNATTFYSNVTLPTQNYTVSLSADSESGPGGTPFIKLNGTTTPPAITYSFIYNANFSNGKYTGWTVTGPGFGTGPLNISSANADGCYYGGPWSNYGGAYFATTYTCGTSVSPGNLTSSPFRVSPKTPFLNFLLVSPQDSLIYVEVLRVNGANETPAVVGHFDTYNVSLGPNESSTFANVSIPLTTLTNKVVRIRVVASTVQPQRYLAIGGFSLGSLPDTDKGISAQINITR